ncbi:alpha-galactosidase [Deinococcus ruber]|uniref:Alpha-galactosidase n=2 Tax=Deinococcus ruber TaxID=1848197 RepID=A0A918CDG4_9DEIO|nr:alpha-galactosidase [Deinococcus ruber]
MEAMPSEAFWILETDRTAYALGVSPEGAVVHTYWGPKLPRVQDYPRPGVTKEWASFNLPAHLLREEYPGQGGAKYTEACLSATFPDGTRDLDLRYVSAEQVGDTLKIHLNDAVFSLAVTLHYRVHAATDLIERWATVQNSGSDAVELNRVFSAQWHVPVGQPYRLTHLTGRWNDEFHIEQQPLTHGVMVLESRRLTTSHQHSPFFQLDAGDAGEEHGEVWFGALAWSGNWKLTAEVTDSLQTRLSLGVNDWDFAWQLEAGQSFQTPACIGGYTAQGFGAASRALHEFIRQEVLPDGHALRKVLYNSWEATFFDVEEASQAELAEVAAGLGVELFVVDDGWFHGRNSDRAGLGDWWPDERKFPGGLTPLIERVKALGMEFGLWIEPEMVNPDSDLYRAHPDWVIHFPSRPRTEARNQLILNLARSDVQDYLISLLDTLLATHDIRFIKWDMNRNVSEPGWPDAGADGVHEARELWVRYVQGLYRVWGTLKERHPGVTWQSCSGGGGRADLGILRLAQQIWISDNTHAAARLAIQDGYSRVFPANTMEAWVTDADRGTLPLPFRFHVSMLGTLGLGGHLARWTPEERAVAREQVARYKEVREVIQRGDQYRLRSAQQQPFSAVEYVSKDRSEAVLFAFRTHIARPSELPPLYLRGLDAEALYTLDASGETKSGAAWMSVGLTLTLKDFESVVWRLRRE